MVLTNVVLLASVPTAVEKKRDPVHFELLFSGRSKDARTDVTHTSNRNERNHIVLPRSGNELVQKFFPSEDRQLGNRRCCFAGGRKGG